MPRHGCGSEGVLFLIMHLFGHGLSYTVQVVQREGGGAREVKADGSHVE